MPLVPGAWQEEEEEEEEGGRRRTRGERKRASGQNNDGTGSGGRLELRRAFRRLPRARGCLYAAAAAAILPGFNLIPRQSLPAGGRRKHPRSVMPHLHLRSFPRRGRVKLALTFLNDPERAAPRRGPRRRDRMPSRRRRLLSGAFPREAGEAR